MFSQYRRLPAIYRGCKMFRFMIKPLESIIDSKGNVDMGLLEKYMHEIPEKALQLGIKVILAILVFYIGIRLIKWIRKILNKALRKSSADMGVIQFLDSLIKVVLTICLVLGIASKFGLETTSLVAILGTASIAIGLALQGSLSNFAGGVLILLLKPFRVGDYIKEDTKENEGTVTEISLFYTKLTTYDGKIIILPNGTLANNSLTNVTGTDSRKIDIKTSISYSSDIRHTREVLLDMMQKETKIIQSEEKIVYVHELADSGVIIGIRCFVKNDDYWNMKWHLTEMIKYTLDENRIEIPYQQMDIHLKQ